MRKTSGEAAGAGEGDGRRRHRMRLLKALIGICRRIERMEVSADAREACRQVAEALTAILGSEQAGGRIGGE